MQTLDRIISSMSCPNCAADLERKGDDILAAGCGTTFAIHDGMPLLAVHGSAETWTNEKPSETSCNYQVRYEDLAAAAGYDGAYRDQLLKRSSTDREKKLLDRLLSDQRHSQNLLNIPSGGGRLSNTLAARTDILIEADIALGQLRFAHQQSGNVDSRIWMTASAFHIPFKNSSVDGVVCCRLCHHLPTAIERERLVAELLRVARRFVIMTFFDYHSPKNYLRRARTPFKNKPRKLTMTREGLSVLAAQHDAELVESPALSYLFSGHRYALMVKREPQAQAN